MYKIYLISYILCSFKTKFRRIFIFILECRINISKNNIGITLDNEFITLFFRFYLNSLIQFEERKCQVLSAHRMLTKIP